MRRPLHHLRKRLRNHVLVSLAAAVVVLPLAACGGAEREEPLELWNPLTGDDGDYMQQMVDAYNATDPDLPVEFLPSPADDLYRRVYSVARTGQDQPDLLLVQSPRIPEFSRSGILDPIDDLVGHEPQLVEENYLASAWAASQVDGRSWGVPLDLHGIIGYYNVDLVEQYGVGHFLDDGVVTMEEVLSLEGRLEEGHYALTNIFTAAMIHNFQYNLGTGLADADGAVDMTGPSWVASYEAVTRAQRAGLLTPEDSDSYQVFRSGRSIFHPDGTWGLTGHQQVEGLRVGVMNAVQLDPRTPTNYVASHTFVQMHDPDRSDERSRGAAAFLEFVRTGSLTWAQAGQLVASRAVYESPEYQQFPQSVLTRPEWEDLLVVDTYEYEPYVTAAQEAHDRDVVYGRTGIGRGLQQMDDDARARIDMAELS